MQVGDIVKFRDGLYQDEKDATYRVLEINGDRVIIQFVSNLPIPPQSVARLEELQLVQATNPTS